MSKENTRVNNGKSSIYLLGGSKFLQAIEDIEKDGMKPEDIVRRASRNVRKAFDDHEPSRKRELVRCIEEERTIFLDQRKVSPKSASMRSSTSDIAYPLLLAVIFGWIAAAVLSYPIDWLFRVVYPNSLFCSITVVVIVGVIILEKVDSNVSRANGIEHFKEGMQFEARENMYEKYEKAIRLAEQSKW